VKYINSIINCNIVPYSYFPHVLSLHILYIQLQTLKYINCIINCNIVPHSYFPHILSLYILYIQLQTVKYINCIIVPHSYFSPVLFLHILYIHLVFEIFRSPRPTSPFMHNSQYKVRKAVV